MRSTSLKIASSAETSTHLACFLVRHLEGGPAAVLDLVARGVVKMTFRLADEIVAVRKLMTRYANVPMALADACLVRMTEIETKATVLTLRQRRPTRTTGRTKSTTAPRPGFRIRRRSRCIPTRSRTRRS
jgi:hypothetical protein